MTTEAKTGTTLSDVQELQERRDALEERHTEYVEREEDLSSKLARLIADGQESTDEAERLREERDAARQEVSDLSAALDVMADRIEEATEEAARGEAGVEIASLKKKVGGIAGQHSQDRRRAKELADKLLETIRRVETNRRRQLHLRALAEALSERFDLELPDFKIVSEGSDDLSKIRKKTAERLARDVETGPDPAAGVEKLDPAEKAAHAADALRDHFGEAEVYAVELLELVGEETGYRLNTVRQAVRRKQKADQERKALEAAMDWLEGRVQKPKHLQGLWRSFKEASRRMPRTDRSPSGLMSDAAKEIGLVRVMDESRNHFYAPPGFEPDGKVWRHANVGE